MLEEGKDVMYWCLSKVRWSSWGLKGFKRVFRLMVAACRLQQDNCELLHVPVQLCTRQPDRGR